MHRHPRRSQGYSMVELVVVLGVIAVMAGIALPRMMSYMRLYKIRGAASSVAGEITTARNRAIVKNVNLGVVFLVIDAQHYRYVLEDDQEPPLTGTRTPLATLLDPANPQYAVRLGPLRTLPSGINFVASGCTNPAFTQNDRGFRFNRMGQWCDPGATDPACPTLDTGAALVMNTTAGTEPGGYVCLQQGTSPLRMTVRVSPGGRTRTAQ